MQISVWCFLLSSQDIKLDTLLLTFQLPERLGKNHSPVIHPHPAGHLESQGPHHRHHRVPLWPCKSYLQVGYWVQLFWLKQHEELHHWFGFSTQKWPQIPQMLIPGLWWCFLRLNWGNLEIWMKLFGAITNSDSASVNHIVQHLGKYAHLLSRQVLDEKIDTTLMCVR